MRPPATIALLLAALRPHLLLAAPASCSDSATPGACRLAQLLSWLQFAAVALAVVLVIVALIALRIVLRNRRAEDPLATRPRR